mgnify:CR=1 FL=1
MGVGKWGLGGLVGMGLFRARMGLERRFGHPMGEDGV